MYGDGGCSAYNYFKCDAIRTYLKKEIYCIGLENLFRLSSGWGGSYWRDSLGDFRGGKLPEIVTLK